MARVKRRVYGVLAEFDTPNEIVSAAQKAKEAGFKDIDAFTPFPIHGLDIIIDTRDARVNWIIFFCGFIGAVSGLALQYYISVIDYPISSGGRPLFSWPSFIPVTFECMILFASLGALIGVLLLCGFPRLYHPIFGAPRIELASQDKFFLLLGSKDPNFNAQTARDFLETLKPQSISEVMEGGDVY